MWTSRAKPWAPARRKKQPRSTESGKPAQGKRPPDCVEQQAEPGHMRRLLLDTNEPHQVSPTPVAMCIRSYWENMQSEPALLRTSLKDSLATLVTLSGWA